MIRIAFKMLIGDVGKFSSLLAGIAFASFLSAFAGCYFTGFLTRSFALVAEHPDADVWVMDPRTVSSEQFANLPASARDRVRSVAGVVTAEQLAVGTADARLPDGRHQPFQIIGVDDATLGGAPAISGPASAELLRRPDAAIVDAGGSEGKLETFDRSEVPGVSTRRTGPRMLQTDDEIFVNDHQIVLAGVSKSLPRFPPRPLLYMTYSNAVRILPRERLRTSFVLAMTERGINAESLAARITAQTGLRARSAADFKSDTVRWFLATSEDVGDITTMLTIAATVGFGLTTVMLYIFTSEHLRQYALLKALGASPRTMRIMVFTQVGICGLLGTGIGLGLCTVAGIFATCSGLPFRMLWFTPVGVIVLNVLACALAGAISLRPVQRLDPSIIFAST